MATGMRHTHSPKKGTHVVVTKGETDKERGIYKKIPLIFGSVIPPL